MIIVVIVSGAFVTGHGMAALAALASAMLVAAAHGLVRAAMLYWIRIA